MTNRRTSQGFTLIELMIVVAVLGVLLSIAYASYESSVQKTRRADAKASLVELANFMERNYSNAMRFDQDAGGNSVTLPFTESPRDGDDVYYNLSLDSVARDSFTLHAAPQASQADDPCGTLTLDHTGDKGVQGASKPASDCW